MFLHMETAKKPAKTSKRGLKEGLFTNEQYAKYLTLSPEQREVFRSERKAELTARLANVKRRKLTDQEKAERKRQREAKKKEEGGEKKSEQLEGLLLEDQQVIAGLLEKHQVRPLENLILATKSRSVSAKDKLAINKFLLPYIHSKKPELKAIDMQANMKMNVTVNVTSFAGVDAEDVTPDRVIVDESEYDEFEEFDQD